MNRTMLQCVILFSFIFFFPGVISASENIRVAVAGPMVGTSNSVGIQYKVGVSAALNSLPGGTLLGRPVVVSLYDDSCNASIAEAVARQIAEDPPAVVIGHSCSAATIAAAPVYAKRKVLQITPASTNPKVTEMGIKTIFRMIGRDDIQGELAAQRIAEKYAGKRIGVLSFSGAYSKGLAKTAVAALAKLGVTPVALMKAKGSQASYADKAEQLISSGVEVLYLVGGALDVGIFLRQARLMEADFAVVGSDTMVSEVFWSTAGDAANNVSYSFVSEPLRQPSAANAAAAIKAEGYEPAGYTLLAYAATQAWIEGVKRAQSFDAGKVAEALRSEPIQTILGEVAFDGKGDISTSRSPFSWYAWKDGRRVRLD